MFYTLINYFDVWGNKKDGYEVNNQCEEGNDFYISDDSNAKEIIQFLKLSGFLSSKADLRTVLVDFVEYGYEIYSKKNRMPLFSLRANN